MKKIIFIALLLAGCSKEKVDPCKTCTTTVETYYLSHFQSSIVTSSVKYCNGEPDTIKQGTVKTKFYTNGTSEHTKVVCN